MQSVRRGIEKRTLIFKKPKWADMLHVEHDGQGGGAGTGGKDGMGEDDREASRSHRGLGGQTQGGRSDGQGGTGPGDKGGKGGPDGHDGKTGARPPEADEYWKFHWDSKHKRQHGRGERIGKKWWCEESHEWQSGGSDTVPALHSAHNAKEKLRKQKAAARYAEEDRLDPEGAEGRAAARRQQNVANKFTNICRVEQLYAQRNYDPSDPRRVLAEQRRMFAEQWNGASSSRQKARVKYWHHGQGHWC